MRRKFQSHRELTQHLRDQRKQTHKIKWSRKCRNDYARETPASRRRIGWMNWWVRRQFDSFWE